MFIAAPKGPKGEFPNILEGNISGPRRMVEVIKDGFAVWRGDLRASRAKIRPERNQTGPKGRRDGETSGNFCRLPMIANLLSTIKKNKVKFTSFRFCS